MATLTTAGLTALANEVIAEFKYIALDASNTAALSSQTGPITEITTNGGGRALAAGTVETYKSVLTKEFAFTGTLNINAFCLMNSGTAGAGTMLMRDVNPTTITVYDTEKLTVICKMDNQPA